MCRWDRLVCNLALEGGAAAASCHAAQLVFAARPTLTCAAYATAAVPWPCGAGRRGRRPATIIICVSDDRLFCGRALALAVRQVRVPASGRPSVVPPDKTA